MNFRKHPLQKHYIDYSKETMTQFIEKKIKKKMFDMLISMVCHYIILIHLMQKLFGFMVQKHIAEIRKNSQQGNKKKGQYQKIIQKSRKKN